MDVNSINVIDGLNQRQVYEEFKKYCKLSSERISIEGVRILHVTNGNPDPYYAMDVEFIPKESKLNTVDSIFVHGINGSGYRLERLLAIGIEKLGSNAFYSKEYVTVLNEQIEKMSNINTSAHTR